MSNDIHSTLPGKGGDPVANANLQGSNVEATGGKLLAKLSQQTDRTNQDSFNTGTLKKADNPFSAESRKNEKKDGAKPGEGQHKVTEGKPQTTCEKVLSVFAKFIPIATIADSIKTAVQDKGKKTHWVPNQPKPEVKPKNGLVEPESKPKNSLTQT